ncbi:lipoprotein-releasing ABC transporter permease subunit [Ferrimonas lipolytica]|uniref:Lipoprotein-releasing ABC transporter permease subunit n=1 Tax=Ferrimonas lipolytica TaxID=2724191 RepID=A0A6H1UC93_9GAMM|nr:lipoprotein-releasing ABC transporter permease subunit [Ferrimonas lipolytica]QIZ75983.1 lipoprotein-releasing ABC transporter permease subunit [Ferrimonas lipolytica]
MAKGLALQIGWRFLRGRNNNGFVSFISLSSVVGITLGVTVLIMVLSAMNGFERELKERLLAVVPHGEFVAAAGTLDDWQKLAAEARAEPGVEAAAPAVLIQGLLQRGDGMKPVSLRGIDIEQEGTVSAAPQFIDAAAWQSLQENQANVVLGAALAQHLNVDVGERVSLLIPAPDARQAPRRQILTVTGLFKMGGEIDNSIAFTNIDFAAKVMGVAGPTSVRIKVSNLFDAPGLVRTIGFRQSQYMMLEDWTRTQGHLYSDIQLVRMLTYLVLVLVVAVASFNIICSLVMAVRDKQAEIAILRTMGMSQSSVLTSFMVQGAVTGAVGCLLGAAIGSLLAWRLSELVGWIESTMGITILSGDVYFIDFLPSQLQLSDVLLVTVLAFIVTLVATWYPAWQASRLKPVEALHR